jgi:hypothetical protein
MTAELRGKSRSELHAAVSLRCETATARSGSSAKHRRMNCSTSRFSSGNPFNTSLHPRLLAIVQIVLLSLQLPLLILD